jgi:hypothetical protein
MVDVDARNDVPVNVFKNGSKKCNYRPAVRLHAIESVPNVWPSMLVSKGDRNEDNSAGW